MLASGITRDQLEYLEENRLQLPGISACASCWLQLPERVDYPNALAKAVDGIYERIRAVPGVGKDSRPGAPSGARESAWPLRICGTNVGCMTEIRISEAATLLGVSDDTVRRWIDQGRLSVGTDASNRQVVPGVELAALARSSADRARDRSTPARGPAQRAQPLHRAGHEGDLRHGDVAGRAAVRPVPGGVADLDGGGPRARARAGHRSPRLSSRPPTSASRPGE